MPKLNPYVLNINRVRTPYKPIDKVRLHASERDIPYSDVMWSYFLTRISDKDIRYYPDCNRAKQLLSHYTKIYHTHLTMFDGSDRALRDIFQVFAQPGNDVLSFDPAFPMYKVYADMFGLNYKTVPYISNTAPITQLLSTINDSTAIVVVSNPCSPVGDTLLPTQLIRLMEKCKEHNALLLVDEAYIEFSTSASMSSTAMLYDHVITIKTLSKAVGSAGVRIGYAVSTEKNAKLLQQTSSMNEISALSIPWLETLIQFNIEVTQYVNRVVKHRSIIDDLCYNKCITFIPSDTNFMHVADLDLGDDVISKTCTFPWSSTAYTRFSIPGNVNSFNYIIAKITQLTDHYS